LRSEILQICLVFLNKTRYFRDLFA